MARIYPPPHPPETEPADYPVLISVDPGGTTGWCVMMVHPEALVDPDIPILSNIIHQEGGQFEGAELKQARELAELIDLWDSAAVLFEDFILRKMSAGRELLSPVRLTAMLDYHCKTFYDTPRYIFKQPGELAMSTATDERLKRWKLYRPGQEHARDALRHSITFFRRAKQDESLRREAWPAFYSPRILV